MAACSCMENAFLNTPNKDQILQENKNVKLYATYIYVTDDIYTRSRRLRSKETKETAYSQAAHKTQRHEATRGLELVWLNPLCKTHHTVAAEISVCHAKEQLDNKKIEESHFATVTAKNHGLQDHNHISLDVSL